MLKGKGGVITIYDIINDRTRAKDAEDNCFKIRNEDPELFKRGEKVVRFLGLSGLWAGYYLSLEIVLFALKEEQRISSDKFGVLV